jgi:tRNA dimethylallyltransferase
MQLARDFPIDIVSMDSAQVYRGMDIGTAKPSREDRARVPHHLIDLIDPVERFSAGRFRDDAMRTISYILARRRIPLIVGGTMLYYRALSGGLDELPQADAGVRSAIDAEAARRGWPALHADLATVDPATAARLEPNDAHRIQRALEVFRLTGRPISSLQRSAPSRLPFELKAFAVVPGDRTELHRRIAARFDLMLAEGLVDEVRGLRQRFALSPEFASMRCVGYRQVWEHIDGAVDAALMREKAIAATRQLAKRQLTWLRSFPSLLPASELRAALYSG